ncbi:B3/B4 domain-containing protein [Enterococcus sp. AZ192]|uniref:B3/B4 domain-containing protein n=1 Tax=unclassified Enterococcus TaxID=2608891 RepID=UPI003D2BEFA3
MNIVKETSKLKKAQLVVSTFDLSNRKYDKNLWENFLTPMIAEIESTTTLEDILDNKRIKKTKLFYKGLGLDPSRHRPSSDSLLRRIVKGQGLYQINALVDLNNYLSLKLHLPIGSYDLSKLNDDLSYLVASKGEEYEGIGKGIIRISNFPVLSDSLGPFGSPISDSTRAMISLETKKAMLVVYSFDESPSGLQAIKSEVEQAINGIFGTTEIQTTIVV